MLQTETMRHEVDPTIGRLVKISFSQFWRGILLFALLVPFLILILTYYYSGFEFMVADIDSIIITPYAVLMSLPALYLFQCLLFRLIIGATYADFTLSFTPKMDRNTPGYWPALFYVSWAYFWRTSLVMGGFYLAKYIFSSFFEGMVISFFSSLLEIFIDILLLRFVVNQPYGNVRLSLLKQEGEV